MFLESLFNRGSVPALERMMAFTEERHQVLANNVSNFDTVDYKIKDLSLPKFQEALREAVDKRDRRGSAAKLEVEPSRQVRWNRDGHLQVRPSEIENSNILFHDKNNRFVEKQMSEMAKNSSQHNAMSEMLRQQYEVLSMAIRGRI